MKLTAAREWLAEQSSFTYYFDAQKNWNIAGSHFLHFANNLCGKNYWDNHDYDEITNRTYLGYQFQNAKYKLALKPFYERQWLGGDIVITGQTVQGRNIT